LKASADHCYKLETECIARQRVAQRDATAAKVVQPKTQAMPKRKGRPIRFKENAKIAEIVNGLGRDWRSCEGANELAEAIDAAELPVDARPRKRGIKTWVDLLDNSLETFIKAIDYRLTAKKSS
jgi:hypothetical protein